MNLPNLPASVVARSTVQPLPAIYPTVTLPYPPSVNNLYFNGKHGRRVLSDRGRKYKADAAKLATAAGMRPIGKPSEVRIEIEVYRPAKRGDLDNVLKVLCDSLKGIAWDDDSQVRAISIERFEAKDNPRVTIRVISE